MSYSTSRRPAGSSARSFCRASRFSSGLFPRFEAGPQEVSRLARLTLQVLELLQEAAQRGVAVYIAKHQMVLDDSLPATIAATVLDLAAQIEREFISARTKEALSRAAKRRGCPSADRKAEPRS